jgi:hypothetical protein
MLTIVESKSPIAPRPYAGSLSLRDAETIALENPSAVFVDIRSNTRSELFPHRVIVIEWTGDADSFVRALTDAVPDRWARLMVVADEGAHSEPAAIAAYAAGYRRTINVADGLRSQHLPSCT